MGIEPLVLSSVLGGLGALWLLGTLVAAWAVRQRVHARRRALAEAPPGEVPRSAWAPSLGESVVSQGLMQSQLLSACDAPSVCSNLTLIDPEFQAWIEAIRDARGAESFMRPFA